MGVRPQFVTFRVRPDSVDLAERVNAKIAAVEESVGRSSLRCRVGWWAAERGMERAIAYIEEHNDVLQSRISVAVAPSELAKIKAESRRLGVMPSIIIQLAVHFGIDEIET